MTGERVGGNFGFDTNRNGGEELDRGVSFKFRVGESLLELGNAIKKILILHPEKLGME